MNKETAVLGNSDGTRLSHESETTLEHVVNIVPKLIEWMIKSGVGYTEFSTALKAVFYNEAIKELNRISQKKTDSAISLLSGLNRRDVRAFCQTYGEYVLVDQLSLQLPVSVPARVLGAWLVQALPSSIPFQGNENSFESLVRQISSEKHPKSILLELKRLGHVIEEGEQVVLQNSNFNSNLHVDENKKIFPKNISDHLAAGILNLTQNTNFLEQAIFADELTQDSIDKLTQLSSDLWKLMSKALVSAAIEYCKSDQGTKNANKRFRLGIYQYDE
ncbi:hypothetical protein IAE19_15115 [Acinetobacter sp. S40]|uniref:hypothetical protein n=1 Tax=Acinetobacter sp. S40 TaxID=2767434 RepID=UPI00190C16EF|nr:hypothetical protein [Acinetobacter sp. S40]MBJ9986761.1 hypothetical protein [Acinetobacter sp. S40]